MQGGGGWNKKTEDGKNYISIKIDDVLKVLCPALNDLNINLWEITDRKSDKSPHWTLLVQKKEVKKTESTENSEPPKIDY